MAIPAYVSSTFAVNIKGSSPVKKSPADLSAWLTLQNSRTGLQSLQQPWHLVIAFQQFDEDGDLINSGTFDELWAGTRRYRTIWKSDKLNQADYATPQGLFRSQDQQWPTAAMLRVANTVSNPFADSARLQSPRLSAAQQTSGDKSLDCSALQGGSATISSADLYCFDPGSHQLRYSRGPSWYQTTYNDIQSVMGITLARKITVYDGGHPFLKVTVQTIEPANATTDADFTPSANAQNLSAQRATGVLIVPTNPPELQWPDSLREKHFSVLVEMIIGKNGKVIDAKAVSGEKAAFKSAESTVRRMTFKPFLVLGEPVEVASKMTLSNN